MKIKDGLENVFGRLHFMAGNNRNFGALQFRRLLKSYILGGGHKIPMQRGSCVKEAEGECVVPISDKKLPDLVDPNFDEAKDTETGIPPLILIRKLLLCISSKTYNVLGKFSKSILNFFLYERSENKILLIFKIVECHGNSVE